MATVKNSASWISENFTWQKLADKDIFVISGISVEKIAAEIFPPFYVYDAATIRRQYERLYEALNPHSISIYYAVKPNTSLAILNGLKKLGTGFDVGSVGELLAVKHINADPKKVSFAGPVKTNEAIELALDYGIHIINTESEEEMRRINILAKKRGKKQLIGIRVNPKKSIENLSNMVMAENKTKFGIDEEQINKDFIKRVKSLANLNLAGVHVYAATNMLDAKSFLANIFNVCKISEKLNSYFPVRYIDFGGGLGIPYTPYEQELPLNKISKHIGDILRQFIFINENKTKLCVEPGRFIVAQSGIYIVRVETVKVSNGRKIVLVDGGIQHMLRPSLLGSAHPIYNLSRSNTKGEEKVDVGGSLCTPIDFLGKEILLPRDTQRGDLLGVFVAGAYGWSEAMPYFMSMQTAAEVLVGNGKFSLIRKSEHPKELLKNQVVPKEDLF